LTTPNTAFHETKLKISWANRHIETLKAALVSFLNTKFCRLYFDKESNPGRSLLKFEMIQPVPEHIPLIIGDVIHNLRSALDIMACKIITLAGEKPSTLLCFPIKETREKLLKTLDTVEFRIMGSAITSIMLDDIKTYKDGGNLFLWALHSLDIIDKHRLLIPVISLTALTNVNIKAGGFTMEHSSLAVDSDGTLCLANMPGDVQLENAQGIPGFEIFFGKEQPLEGHPVIPTLYQLSQSVSDAVLKIEQSLPTNPQNPT